MYDIEYLKSGLSVSTHLGCTLNCAYCVLSSISSATDKPLEIATVDELEKKLFDKKSLYFPGRTPLIVNNRTDPFLPGVSASTYKILDMFIKNDVKSPVIIITKLIPPLSLYEYAEKLNLMVFFTYGGLPPPFEPKRDIGMMDEFCAKVSKNSRYHYLRPIIEGVNDDINMIDSIIEYASKRFRATVLTGLRIIPSVVEKLYNKAAYVLKERDYDNVHKFLLEGLMDNVWRIRDSKAKGYPVFKHTSCAIAFHVGKPEPLGYVKRKGHCDTSCPMWNTCNMFSPTINRHVIEYIIRNSGCNFDIGADNITFHGEISQELKASIRFLSGMKVNAEKITLSPSESEFLG
ncbi:MAG: hypothetical protein M1160_03945 [Candidatus Marsarchaeota archaeon]|jgi:DNA repair photolyase|nr:hypothetical protein [Candidatus Marsarchaeota archaeon]MCL5111994.1 hypothetical protein [Candidatus Marsarchaeota archaeon]